MSNQEDELLQLEELREMIAIRLASAKALYEIFNKNDHLKMCSKCKFSRTTAGAKLKCIATSKNVEDEVRPNGYCSWWQLQETIE